MNDSLCTCRNSNLDKSQIIFRFIFLLQFSFKKLPVEFVAYLHLVVGYFVFDKNSDSTMMKIANPWCVATVRSSAEQLVAKQRSKAEEEEEEGRRV